MAKNKGCVNKECTAFTKKTLFDNKNNFCPICGEPLYYVCKKCHTQLEENTKLCIRHLEEREDKIDKAKKTGGKVIAGAGLVAAAIGKNGGKIVKEVVKRIK